ncbi:hypothetical protein PSTT_10130 [Puccinia striiformis]|uniref:Uncharacterized protein n=1 Tax=Puccinia striiformis TaxID=27350 RepID=A0A2S4V5L9_9BASI|nr:hypothetical protein PSTT_10130 [Puccinia striiformis]
MFSPAILKVVVLMSLPMRKVPCRSKPPRVTHILGDRNTTNILSLTSLVNPCAKPERSLLKHLSSLLSPHSCKRGKRTLSSAAQSSIEVEILSINIDFDTSLTCACFEGINLFGKNMEPVDKILRDLKFNKAKVGPGARPCWPSNCMSRVIKSVSDSFNGQA